MRGRLGGEGRHAVLEGKENEKLHLLIDLPDIKSVRPCVSLS